MKRAVLQHRSGLRRILGVLEPGVHEIKPFITIKHGPDGEEIEASLLQTKPRYALYQQIIAQPMGQLNVFHPEQK